tara:strand:+ start:6635 stop:7840 length:1206 start_codon:yes stop_codon:yes gene_type:complete
MTFTEFQSIFYEGLGLERPSDIARELDVSPQVINNWKSRDFVPPKYVNILKTKIQKSKKRSEFPVSENIYNSGQSLGEMLLYMAELVKNNYLITLLLPFIFFLLFYIEARFFLSPIYESKAKLVPISENASSSVGGLASQFGITIKEEQVTGLSSTIMYPDVLMSRTLARRLISKKINTNAYGDSVKLQYIFSPIKGDTSKNAQRDSEISAVDKMLESIRVVGDKNTPLMTIYVAGFEPDFTTILCKMVIDELQILISEFNLKQVVEKKFHLEERIIEIGNSLDNAEEDLRKYIERNRNIISSPSLILEQERLNREAEVLKQMYVTIKTQYEMAQIEEIDRKGLMQILDPPELIGKVFPNIRKRAILGFFVGAVLCVILIFTKDWYIRNKAFLKLINLKKM